jgi:hypothetical protein
MYMVHKLLGSAGIGAVLVLAAKDSPGLVTLKRVVILMALPTVASAGKGTKMLP